MDQQQIGRLAMRQEGGFWNAYWAKTDSMNDAVLIGSIKMSAVMGNDDRKEAFMDMMRDVLCDVIEQETGILAEFGGPVGAPEHERAGNA